jgi:hypothetical protein
MFDADAISHEVINRVLSHHQKIGRYLYRDGSADSPTEPFRSSPLRDEVVSLVRIANGEIDRATADEQMVGAIVESVQRMIELLFVRADESYGYSIPDTFWLQPGIGQVLAHVQAWLRGDDLIGYTEAAHLLFDDLAEENIQAARMRVRRMAERGTLMSYVDPDEANPTRRMRVSRQAVEALCAAGRIEDGAS